MIDYYHYFLSRHNDFYGVYDVDYHLYIMDDDDDYYLAR